MEHGRKDKGPARHPSCLCGAMGTYSDDWDAYYCPADGTWLEDVCGHDDCSFCSHRPERYQT